MSNTRMGLGVCVPSVFVQKNSQTNKQNDKQKDKQTSLLRSILSHKMFLDKKDQMFLWTKKSFEHKGEIKNVKIPPT